MRVVAIVVLLLSNACAPSMAVSTTGGTDNVQTCGRFDECFGGTGGVDGMVSFAVGSAIVGTLAYVLARRLQKPRNSRAAPPIVAPAPASSRP